MAEGIRDLLERARELMSSTGALKVGEFTLASGKRSSYYLDSKLFSLHPEGSELLGELLYSLVKDVDANAIGGMAHAAIPLVTMVSNVSHRKGNPIPSFYVREDRKDHGTMKKIEGYAPSSGDPVAVLDDVVTTGGSIIKAIEAVEEDGGRVAKVITLLERHEGGAEKLRQKYDFVSVFTTNEQGELLISYPGFEETGDKQQQYAMSV